MRTPSKRLGQKKSRKGCLRCKARHVKCDELRPCTNCVRFDVVCSLTLPADEVERLVQVTGKKSSTSTKSASKAGKESSTPSPQLQGRESITPHESTAPRESITPLDSSTPQQSIEAPSLSIITQPAVGHASPSTTIGWTNQQPFSYFPVSWMQSLRLVHHYTIASSDIFSPDACTSEIWRVTVPQAAFSHEFLMHGLLAVSALHYAQTHPDEREEYLIISSHYQGLALQFFATRLGDISDDNFEPFFFLATFIFLWNIYTFSDAHQDAKPVSTAEIAQSFKLLHGIKSICDARPSGWREDGPLAPLFEQWEVFPVDRTGPFHAQMDRLYDLARDLNPSFDAINTQSSCLLAIETLRTTYAACMCDKSEKQAQRIWFWPITLTQVFMDLVKTNHPVALIILAHYAALARTFEKNNWINMGWSAKVMGAVETTLDEKWKEWVAWPFKSLRDEIDVNKMDPPNT